MSADGTYASGEPGRRGEPGASSGGEPTEEDRSEIGQRAAYEAELSRLTTTDMLAQAAVSLLNIGARRMAPPSDDPSRPGERDPEQARDAIDAVRALLEILERRIPPQELAPLRDALSRLQMAYAREMSALGQPAQSAAPGERPVPGGAAGSDADSSAAPQGQDSARQDDQRPGPGPAEASGRLWVPGR